MNQYFVTANHTSSGKTIASALLCRQLQAAYFKPVQAGDLDNTDSMTVKRLAPNTFIYEELFKLSLPISPHAAARHDGLSYSLSDFRLPVHEGPLVVEGAGGLLSPINQDHTCADLIAALGLPVILVINFYLGSINHTMLTIEVLQSLQLEVAGIIYNGSEPQSEEFIRGKLPFEVLGRLPTFDALTAQKLAETEVVFNLPGQHPPR